MHNEAFSQGGTGMCAQRILRGGPPPSISLLVPTTDAETNGFLLYPSLIGSYEAVGGSSGCARAYTRADKTEGPE